MRWSPRVLIGLLALTFIALAAFNLGYALGQGRAPAAAVAPRVVEEQIIETTQSPEWADAGVDAINGELAQGWSLKGVYQRNVRGGNRQVFHLVRYK